MISVIGENDAVDSVKICCGNKSSIEVKGGCARDLRSADN
jgi:hypothetical protein